MVTDAAVLVAPAAADKLILLVLREENYSGEGRVHQLQLDDRTLGPLTRDNFYRLELWPGNYYLNVHLPAETFLGETKPPINVGRFLRLEPYLAGHILVYRYMDGQGLERLEIPPRSIAAALNGRRIALDLPASESAHVTRFLDADYDGPSLYGRPNGRGVLSWEDGCRYEGEFVHGQMTSEGKFYYKDGRIFMGQLYKGRPKGRGVLLSAAGRILFAGPFEDEVPNGLGLRIGDVGVEYCRYEKGRDITKTVFELARESVLAEELSEMRALQELALVAPYDVLPWIGFPDGGEPLVIGQDNGPRPDDKLRRGHEERITHMVAEIKAQQAERLEKERTWCSDELAVGRDWCVCAPFNPQGVAAGSCMR